MTQPKLSSWDFLEELEWLLAGGCSGYELESGFGQSMKTIRRRVQRWAERLELIAPAWPLHEHLLRIDRRLNELDVEARNRPVAA